MNVAFFSDTFLPKVDGIVTSILNTAGELLDRGHNVLVIAPRIRKDQEESVKQYDPRIQTMFIKGINALFYPDYRLTPPMTPWIKARLERFKADIIHFHTPFTMGFEAILASKLLKLPLVSTFHTYFCEPEYLKIVKLQWVPGLVHFGWVYSNFFHDRCHMTISPSDFTARELERKKLKSPLMILSNGIPLQNPGTISMEHKESIKAKYGLKDRIMLYIGRVSEEKGIDILIKATGITAGRHPDSCLLIIGGGPAEEKLKKLTIEMNLEEHVRFTGPIPHKDLINSGIFEISSFFATASTSENQPMTIIEACMFGLPVIGVDAKGIPEMIKGNGCICPSGDYEKIAESMINLLENHDLREKMSEKSREIGKSYDIRKTTDQMLDLYNSLIDNKNKQTA